MPLKFADVAQIPNGAEFYTADLHIHTFGGSHDVKDASMTVDAVLEQATKSGISVLAITDHNSIKNTERSLEVAQQYAGRLLVLAGVEVTTAHGHLLVYFDPSRFDQLQTFFGRIGVHKSGTAESHTTMSMSDVATEALRLGGVCVAAHIDISSGFEMSAVGYPNWKKDIVSNPGILGVEVVNAAHLHWYSSEDDASPEGAERKKLLEGRAKSPGGAGRAILAHLQNSDAHTLQAFVDARNRRSLTRFKMDTLSFEGFRTALADPDARVRAVVQLPPSIPKVIGMHAQGGFLHAETYRFSDNLTCFIGGRGTGKSTALKTLAYGLGACDELDEYDNCADTVVVFCRDGQGITYRYERMRGSTEPSVQAAEKGKAIEVPADVFRLEYYGQGDLARIAEDPLSNPELFQEFLDRHSQLRDLEEQETELVAKLEQNSSLLLPLAVQEGTRAKKANGLEECKRKLELAEEGQLKTIATTQAEIGAEKSLVETLQSYSDSYGRGVSLKNFLRDFDSAARGAGKTTDDASSVKTLAAMKKVIDDTNAEVKRQEKQLTTVLGNAAKALKQSLGELATNHRALELAIAQQVTELQKAGLSASLADHQTVVKRRGRLAAELAKLDQELPELRRLQAERDSLLAQLDGVRSEFTRRRKEQVKEINKHLAKVIDDYTVVVIYEETGLLGKYLAFVREAMQGTYLQEDLARQFCEASMPRDVATLVRKDDRATIAKLGGLGEERAGQMCERLSDLATLHALEAMSKPARPIIKVVTKGGKPKQIPVNQLSDGQKHTILLTIAMLAESEAPLVIDQPEDDLDNAFIFSSVVRMLREVKERRQVILVTHNANIAVLGDAELILPMRRSVDRGVAFDMGSIDRSETRAAVQSILEGGEVAFLRRKEIYGH